MLLLRGNLLVDSAQAQLCSACQSFAMAHISATIKFRVTVRNKQFEAKQTGWMVTISITRALQTRIPILGSEGQMCKTLLSLSRSSCSCSCSSSCAAEALLGHDTKTGWERSQTLEVTACSSPRASLSNTSLGIAIVCSVVAAGYHILAFKRTPGAIGASRCRCHCTGRICIRGVLQRVAVGSIL